ncbi:MAG TPA: hypothetical protein VK540_03940 [Polyangiaceae bacterium]|nr:hypothetical protein [Polyangiaceae bacterium]
MTAPPRSGPAFWLCAAMALVVEGCASPLDAPSVYESEVFLCAPDQADRFNVELERCRNEYDRDGSCGGLVSFTGRLYNQPLVVDSRIDVSRFEDLLRADGVRIRDQVKLSGISPYFRFRVRFWEMGGDMLGDERSLDVIASVAPGAQPFLDRFVHASIRLSASGQSVESPALNGNVSLSVQTVNEEAGTFHLGFGEDAIDGCFHAFLTEYSLLPGNAM